MRLFALIFPFFLFDLLQAQTPGPRDHFGLVYDNNRDRIVLFGGNDLDENGKYKWNPTTWEWDGTSWELKDENGIGEVSSITTVYDPGSQNVISVGGYKAQVGNIEATWVWDGSSWTQQEGSSPGPRSSCPIAYDQKNNQVVLFSGCAGRPYPTDTYLLKENGWIKVAESGPPGVCRGALFFDEVRGTVVLFGGSTSNDGGWERSNIMWEWDGSGWEEILVDVKPQGRSNILMAYDSNRKRAILFGGKTEDQVVDDLWEWDGVQWHQIEQSGDWPRGVETYGIAYHTRLKKTFLYGGRTGPANPIEDFWSWDGSKWEKLDL